MDSRDLVGLEVVRGLCMEVRLVDTSLASSMDIRLCNESSYKKDRLIS